MTIIIICAVICLLIQFWPPYLNLTERAILFGAYYKAFIAAGEWWRFLTVGFVHVSFLHLMMNMLSLHALGRALEPSMKTAGFLILLFGSVIGGSVFLFCTSGNTVGVGLSGGLYGLLAAYIYLMSIAGAMKIPQVRSGVYRTVLMNLLINFMPGVAWRAHFGGAVTGLLLIMILSRRNVMDDLKRNSIIAFCILLLVSAAAVKKNAYINRSERYLRTDINLLRCESSLGMTSYAADMAKNLDRIYDSSELEQMFH